MKAKIDLETVRAFCDRCPFNRWLGLTIVEIGDNWLRMTMPWKTDLLSSPELQLVHGGVLASLIDSACGYAAALVAGHTGPTVDLVTDYHKAAVPGPLEARAEVIRAGRSLITARAEVRDCEGNLVASGRIVAFGARANNLGGKVPPPA